MADDDDVRRCLVHTACQPADARCAHDDARALQHDACASFTPPYTMSISRREIARMLQQGGNTRRALMLVPECRTTASRACGFSATIISDAYFDLHYII